MKTALLLVVLGVVLGEGQLWLSSTSPTNPIGEIVRWNYTVEKLEGTVDAVVIPACETLQVSNCSCVPVTHCMVTQTPSSCVFRSRALPQFSNVTLTMTVQNQNKTNLSLSQTAFTYNSTTTTTPTTNNPIYGPGCPSSSSSSAPEKSPSPFPTPVPSPSSTPVPSPSSAPVPSHFSTPTPTPSPSPVPTPFFPSPTPSLSPSPSPTPTPQVKGGGKAIGIIVGSTIGIMAAVGFSYLAYQCYRQNKAQNDVMEYDVIQ